MASIIAETIANRADDMPAGERRAAQALIANYPMLGLRTVAEFAQRAGVSSPTILRLVSRIGFHNYAEFQSALNDELAERLQSPLNRATNSRRKPSQPLVAAIVDNIAETFRQVTDRQMAAMVEQLADRRNRVTLLGGRLTFPIASYLAAHLAIMRPHVVALGGQESNWRDSLIDVDRRDTFVVFDIRRYQDSLLTFAEAAARRGATIILVTDQWLSPIARVARHVVAARTAVPSPWDSSAALFAVAEQLVAGVTARLGEESARRMELMDSLRDEMTKP